MPSIVFPPSASDWDIVLQLIGIFLQIVMLHVLPDTHPFHQGSVS